MSGELLVFLVLALIAVASALGMLLSRNAVYSALYLILNFAAIAVLYLELGAPFIALAQVSVYAGAIMVLFLFVIMLLGAEKLSEVEVLPWQRPLAIGLAVLLVVEGVYVIFFGGRNPAMLTQAPLDFANPQDIGLTLFNQFILPFEITSVILLVAVIGAIILTKQDKK